MNSLRTTDDTQRRRDWRAFWVFYFLAVAFATLLLPYATTGLFRDGVAAIDRSGLVPNTSLATGAHVLAVEPEAWKALLLLVLGPATPLLAAVLTTIGFDSWTGLRRLADRLRPWREGVSAAEGLRLWGLLVGFYAVMNLTIAGVRRFLLPAPYSEGYRLDLAPSFTGLLLVLLGAMFLDGGGLLEETGWRGFALPRLQRLMTPLRTALFLGLLWGLWHVPIKFATLPALWEAPAYFVSYYAIYLCGAIGLTVIIHTFVNRTGGSLLIAIAAHGLGNDSIGLRGVWGDWTENAGPWGLDSLLVGLGTMTFVIVLFAVLVVAATRGQLGLRDAAPATNLG